MSALPALPAPRPRPPSPTLAHWVCLAQKLQVCGRLIEEVRELTRDRGIAEDAEIHQGAGIVGHYLDYCFATAAVWAGPDFRAMLQSPEPRYVSIGSLIHHVLLASLPDLRAMAADDGFVYRDIATLLLALRERLDGLTPAPAVPAPLPAGAVERIRALALQADRDPGHFVARDNRGAHLEPLHHWQARAWTIACQQLTPAEEAEAHG